MKYRLVELLMCPSHPDAMLRVTEASLSDIFPFGGDIRIPVCRTGCGMLGNWFKDIPEVLPPQHRFDCRRCFGTEIESAVLTCPECEWRLEVRDGVVQGGGVVPVAVAGEDLPAKVTVGVEKLLALQPGEIALIMAKLPETWLNKWCGKSVERLEIEISVEELLNERAISCTNGLGMAHYISGPLDIAVIRPGMLDVVVVSMPSELITGDAESVGLIPAMLRPSGRVLLIYKRDRAIKSGANCIENYRSGLPEAFRELEGRVAEVGAYDLVIFRHSEAGNGNGNEHANGNGKVNGH